MNNTRGAGRHSGVVEGGGCADSVALGVTKKSARALFLCGGGRASGATRGPGLPQDPPGAPGWQGKGALVSSGGRGRRGSQRKNRKVSEAGRTAAAQLPRRHKTDGRKYSKCGPAGTAVGRLPHHSRATGPPAAPGDARPVRGAIIPCRRARWVKTKNNPQESGRRKRHTPGRGVGEAASQ